MLIDTPDYQRGVVSAQVLLGTIPAGNFSDTIGLPPNIESLVVVSKGFGNVIEVFVTGVTSGINYPGTALQPGPQTVGQRAFVFDVSSAVDDQVVVHFTVAAGFDAYIYADYGVHISADLSKLANQQGSAYVIPTVPNVITGDHPPNELDFVSQAFAASGSLLGAPGSGRRWRVFSVQMAVWSGTPVGLVYDSVSSDALMTIGPGQACGLPFPLTGVPLANDAALDYSLSSGTGTVGVCAVYTLESAL